MRKSMKAAVGLLAAAAMLAVPAFSNADGSQGSQQPPSSAQATCDSTSRSVGTNVNGQLSEDGNGGCKLTVTASDSNNELNRDTFKAFPGLNDVTRIEFAGTNRVKFPANSSNLFENKSNLKSFDFGNAATPKVDTSNVTNMSGMFMNDTSLTSLDLSSFNTSNVTNMTAMFYYNMLLTSLDISGFDTTKVTGMSNMFNSCEKLLKLDFGSNFHTSNVTNMEGMFSHCSGLTSLDLSGFDTAKVTNMNSMFSSCSGLTSLNVGNNFDTKNVRDMGYMFANCDKLVPLKLGDKFDTSNNPSMMGMFVGDSVVDLSKFTITYNTDLGGIFGNYFDTVHPLKQLTIGKNVSITDNFGGDRADNRHNLGFDDAWITWAQVAEPGTPSADVNNGGVKYYDFGKLWERTRSDDPSRVGTYVRMNWGELNLKPAKDAKVTGSETTTDTGSIGRGSNVPKFDSNGNPTGTYYPTSQVITGLVQIPEENPFTPTETATAGYTFLGWSRTDDGNIKNLLQPGDYVDINDGKIDNSKGRRDEESRVVTLYATWGTKESSSQPGDTGKPSDTTKPDTGKPGDSGKPGKPSDTTKPDTGKPGDTTKPGQGDSNGSNHGGNNGSNTGNNGNTGSNHGGNNGSNTGNNGNNGSNHGGNNGSNGSSSQPGQGGQGTGSESGHGGAPVSAGIGGGSLPGGVGGGGSDAGAAGGQAAAGGAAGVQSLPSVLSNAPALPVYGSPVTALANTPVLSRTSPNAAAGPLQPLGHDADGTPALPQQSAPKNSVPQCVPVAYWYGTGVEPIALRCPGQDIATSTAAASEPVHQAPVWIFLLLVLAALGAMMVISRRGRLDIVRHRSFRVA